MSKQAADNELRGRFNTVWANRTPVAWPNVVFVPPSPQSIWCRFRITDGDSQQTTFGASTNNFRSLGVVFIQLFEKPGIGDALGATSVLKRADEAAAIFRNWCGTNVRCRAATIKNVGSISDGWYLVNITVPFVRNELL